jgi:hypothetical protein
MFSTSKVKKAKNSYGGYRTEFAGSTRNSKKIIRTPNLPIETKIFLKKTIGLLPKKCKGAKNSYWSYPTDLLSNFENKIYLILSSFAIFNNKQTAERRISFS